MCDIYCQWGHEDCTAYWFKACVALTSCVFPGRDECPFYKTVEMHKEQYRKRYGDDEENWPEDIRNYLSKFKKRNREVTEDEQ